MFAVHLIQKMRKLMLFSCILHTYLRYITYIINLVMLIMKWLPAEHIISITLTEKSTRLLKKSSEVGMKFSFQFSSRAYWNKNRSMVINRVDIPSLFLSGGLFAIEMQSSWYQSTISAGFYLTLMNNNFSTSIFCRTS